jgi:hypothetical protein
MEDRFKVMYMTLTSGVIRTFTFDSYEDDKQNKRYLFHDENSDKVLTLFFQDISYMITAPIKNL